MQPVINAPEIATAREQQLFNGKNFHVFIYNKHSSLLYLGAVMFLYFFFLSFFH